MQKFTEFGYVAEYQDGSRGPVTPIATEPHPVSTSARERAAGMFRAIQHGAPGARLMFVSRRLTCTPWTDERTDQ